ncbi:putative subtilisin [Xylogone sp. PMI_703]|nr:putative subtilisin [Xylogone sp. PMI_703]
MSGKGEKGEKGEREAARGKNDSEPKKRGSRPSKPKRLNPNARQEQSLSMLLSDVLDEFSKNYVPGKCEKLINNTPGNAPELQEFEKSIKGKLKKSISDTRDRKENLFHTMVKESWPKTPEQREFLNWMLQQQEYQILLELKDHRGLTPMHNALYEGLVDFVDAVLEVKGLKIISILEKKCFHGNCLHLATEKSFSNLSKMINICEGDKDIFMGDEKSPEDTPLHIAVQKLLVPVRDEPPSSAAATVDDDDGDDEDGQNWDNGTESLDDEENQYTQQNYEDINNLEGYEEELDKDYRESASDVEWGSSFEQHDEDGHEDRGKIYEPESLRYRLETLEEREERLRQLLNNFDKEIIRPRPPSKTQGAKPTTAQHLDTEDVKNFLTDGGDTYTSSASHNTLTLGLTELPLDHNVRLLVEACPEALTTKNKSDRTPYQEREYFLLDDPLVQILVKEYAENKESDGSTEEVREARAKRLIVVKDPIAHYLRSFSVRKSKSREETMKRLYKPGQECHIEFDLAGFPTTIIKEEYLNQLETHLKFESILKYVALPVLSVESQPVKGHRSKSKPQGVTQPEIHRNGRSDLVAVFDWLWRRGVREIIKVMVVDGDPPHANGAIVEALYGFKVEEWDWKRVDLSSDVISESSLAIREVSLYSSGNDAVLMGWASAEGLGNRKKFPHLEKVNLFVQEGLEDNGRWNWNNRRCQEGIIKQAGKGPNGKDIDVKIIADNNPIKFSSELSTTEKIEEVPAWIKSVEDFSTFLSNSSMVLGNDNHVPPVKIAIIDDGIDATMYDFQAKIAGGATFCPYPHSADLVNSYFVPRGKHGTLMAQLICRICPGTQLYIARLEELPTLTGNGRRVTARSAAKAVDWAVSCGVDIISMSWTIQTAVQENEDMKKFEAAINRAYTAKVLMFCSASDQGANSKEPCYPGHWQQCIRIGGATFTGEKLTWVDDNVDFWFPGRNVPFHSKDGRSVVYESGSSIATAAASGLAGVLIYSARLLKGKTLKGEDNLFHDRDRMAKAFANMAKGKDGKFPRTEDTLDKLFKTKIRLATNKPTKNINFETLSWTKETMKALEDLLNNLQGL